MQYLPLVSKHKYLILDRIVIHHSATQHFPIEERNIYTGAQIKKMLSLFTDPVTARTIGYSAVYDITSKTPYLFWIDEDKIPSTPVLIPDPFKETILIPLRMLLDMDPSKLPKYINHPISNIKNFAMYLLSEHN